MRERKRVCASSNMNSLIGLVDSIDDLLPQTQCRRCGYDGCRPYAQAISDGIADINQCPPGGAKVIEALAHSLGRQSKPLDPRYGEERLPLTAFVDEAQCIGCTLCLQACPVDAIVGAAKHMHTVISLECTDCELCIPVCPVDCISRVPRVTDDGDYSNSFAVCRTKPNHYPWDTLRARLRYQAHQQRVKKRQAPTARMCASAAVQTEKALKQAAIAAALARVRAKRDSLRKVRRDESA